MRDIIFLFGAGASYGAGSILPETPPLGFQLYSVLEQLYPSTWGALPQNIKEGFLHSNNFEIGMKLIYEQIGGYIPILMRDMAIYFIQFRPHNKASLYCRLIQDIQKIGLVNRTLFSTLNYECLLEYSLLEHGLPISYFDDANLPTIPVWKLHGSCNMFSQSIQASPGVSYSTGVTWDGNVQAILDPDKVIQHCLVETALGPVMSLYMEGKILDVCPSVIKQLQQTWTDRVSSANMLFLIGINPNIQDAHIWEPLAESKAFLFFVGDKKALETWKETSRAGSIEFLSDKFNIAYPSILRRLNTHATNQ